MVNRVYLKHMEKKIGFLKVSPSLKLLVLLRVKIIYLNDFGNKSFCKVAHEP